jgi:hypothetical protein
VVEDLGWKKMIYLTRLNKVMWRCLDPECVHVDVDYKPIDRYSVVVLTTA